MKLKRGCQIFAAGRENSATAAVGARRDDTAIDPTIDASESERTLFEK